MARLFLLTIISVALAGIIHYSKQERGATRREISSLPKDWLSVNSKPVTPSAVVRPADQTFLTFPEWYLVFGPQEQTDYFQHHTSTSFPFMTQVNQFWDSYKIVNDQIKDHFPVNTGYHFMIWVIGTSSTVEYAAKAWYETVIGKLTDTGAVVTPEDQFNFEFNRDYVTFIKDRPWYEFDFGSQLGKLWSLDFSTTNFLRSAERRYVLTSELLTKILYGKLIGIGTQTVYDVALPTTSVLIDRSPSSIIYRNAKQIHDSVYLVLMTRYDQFKDEAKTLAQDGVNFHEIAGNTSAILVSVIDNVATGEKIENGAVFFSQTFASDERRTRIVVATPVAKLGSLLRELETRKLVVEHVFDF